MRYYIVAIIPLILGILLDGQVDSLRQQGISNLILDSAPSLLSGLLVPLAIVIALKLSRQSTFIAACYCVGITLYEMLQGSLFAGVFDIKDVVASIICIAFWRCVHKANMHWGLSFKQVSE